MSIRSPLASPSSSGRSNADYAAVLFRSADRKTARHIAADLARRARARQAGRQRRRLDAWSDAVPGLTAIKQHALIAPLSNGNFDDMAALARHAGLPWDVLLGSSLARHYKPHPEVYLSAARALNLDPSECCMVAAHQFDLHFAAGHGMQTAFVMRPLEFGGAIRPAVLEAGVDYSYAAEMHAEYDWTYIATDFLHLSQQHAATLAGATH